MKISTETKLTNSQSFGIKGAPPTQERMMMASATPWSVGLSPKGKATTKPYKIVSREKVT